MSSGIQNEVTVVIPCYNQAKYLPCAVESAVKQTCLAGEIIIINDGSTDNFAKVAGIILKRYAGYRIRVINQKNQGLAAARNAGIRRARGQYILPLDADDLLHPKMIETLKKALNENPKVGIVYTDILTFGYRHYGKMRRKHSLDWDPQRILFENLLPYCSLFRKEVWRKVGGYSPYSAGNDAGYEDWGFWISCAEHGFIGKRIPGHYFYYRLKKKSMFTAAQRKHDVLAAKIVLRHAACYSKGEVAKAKFIIARANEKNRLNSSGF